MILATALITITHFNDPFDYVLCIAAMVVCVFAIIMLGSILRGLNKMESVHRIYNDEDLLINRMSWPDYKVSRGAIKPDQVEAWEEKLSAEKEK